MKIEDIEFGKWYKYEIPQKSTGQYFGESPAGVLVKKYDSNYALVPHADVISKEVTPQGWTKVEFFNNPFVNGGYALAVEKGKVWFSKDTHANKERIQSIYEVDPDHITEPASPPVETAFYEMDQYQ